MRPTFDALFKSHSWRPIRNCPGRYLLRGGPFTSSINDLFDPTLAINEHRTSAAPDMVIVAEIDGGGLISYRHKDGAYVHTLNTPDGFLRKLAQLGISRASKDSEPANQEET